MTETVALEFIWYVAFVILITGYAILDGFDLGIGMLHLFAREDLERRLMLNAIGPIWDGNEVWLITAGGALFAGFPEVYATLASAFYIPIMIFLSGIIFRAVAIEFRSKQPMPWWRATWDVIFSVSSFTIALGLGFILGNLIGGITLDAQFEFQGSFSDFMHPYAFLIAILTAALFMMHGAIFLMMKTDGPFHDKMRVWLRPVIILFTIVYALSTMATLVYYPHMAEAMRERWIIFIIAGINVFAVANIPREIFHGRDSRAFASSCLNIICLMVLYSIGTFPNMIRAINDPTNLSLTLYNGASSEKTLMILITIACIGIPLVISYTFMIYYIFRGKVKIDTTSY